MKGAINGRFILGVVLLAFGGAVPVPAAEMIGYGQEQARLLLSGAGAPLSGPQARLVPLSSSSAKAVASDGQAQAREMILGRKVVKTQIMKANGLRAAGAGRDRKVAEDPQEMGRRMILGRKSAGSLAKIRLTSKAE